MFEVRAEKARLQVERREVLTSGSVNAYRVRFTFSREWEGLERRAVFRAGDESRTLPLDGSGECAIPWEVLARPGLYVQAGVYGVGAGETVLPTVWANLGAVLEGAAPGEEARPPTPALWEELLAGKADSLDYTPEGRLGLYSGAKLLSAVAPRGGADGVSDHGALAGRDAPRQHPVASIAGLPEELRRIPAPAEALTNEELEDLLQ